MVTSPYEWNILEWDVKNLFHSLGHLHTSRSSETVPLGVWRRVLDNGLVIAATYIVPCLSGLIKCTLTSNPVNNYQNDSLPERQNVKTSKENNKSYWFRMYKKNGLLLILQSFIKIIRYPWVFLFSDEGKIFFLDERRWPCESKI